MGVRLLNLRDFAYLCAIAEYRHFGRAAEACAITQPALSERVRRIEEALDIVVFERTKRSVLLTPTGKDIVERARRLLEEADAIDVLARAHHGPLIGEFRVGIIATLGPYLMPRLLRQVRKAYPQLQLQLTEGQNFLDGHGLFEPLVSRNLPAIEFGHTADGNPVRQPVFSEFGWFRNAHDFVSMNRGR